MKQPHIRNILVPIDFSKMSIQAIAAAKNLATRFDANVHLAHIHDFEYPPMFMTPAGILPPAVMLSQKEVEEKLALRLRAVAVQNGLPPSAICHVATGHAFEEICQFANKLPVDLIVTSTHGHTGLKHVFLGSTAERIVQHAPCPVLVARQRPRSKGASSQFTIDKILVPVDFSDCSMEGVQYAVGFAERFAAKLILLHVAFLGYAYTSDGYAMYDLKVLKDAVRKSAERQMRDFVRSAKLGAVKFETTIRVGSPGEQICAFAEGENVDLIISSTHGRTGFKHVLLGSTAEYIVRHARRLVLVVPSRFRTVRNALKKTGRLNQKAETKIVSEKFTRKYRKLTQHLPPERRKTNKFRETHLVGRF